MNKSLIDLWARFLSHEKLDASRVEEKYILKLVSLCEELAKSTEKFKPFRSYKDRLDTRKFLCTTAMDMGIDLPDIRHKTTGHKLIGRGLLDMWLKVYAVKYGSAYGTAALFEQKRRDIKTRLSKELS